MKAQVHNNRFSRRCAITSIFLSSDEYFQLDESSLQVMPDNLWCDALPGNGATRKFIWMCVTGHGAVVQVTCMDVVMARLNC